MLEGSAVRVRLRSTHLHECEIAKLEVLHNLTASETRRDLRRNEMRRDDETGERLINV